MWSKPRFSPMTTIRCLIGVVVLVDYSRSAPRDVSTNVLNKMTDAPSSVLSWCFTKGRTGEFPWNVSDIGCTPRVRRPLWNHPRLQTIRLTTHGEQQGAVCGKPG